MSQLACGASLLFPSSELHDFSITCTCMYLYVCMPKKTKLCCLLLWFQVHIRVYENAHFSNSAETHFTGITCLLIPANSFTVFIHACTNMCKYVHNTYHTYIHMVHIHVHVHVHVYTCTLYYISVFLISGGKPRNRGGIG